MKKITLFLAAAISTASVFPSFAGSNLAVVPAVYGTFQTTAANTQTTGTLTVQVPAGYIQETAVTVQSHLSTNPSQPL